jgi:hypothetical protein
MAVESYHECPEYTRPMSEGATVREVIQRHHEQSGIAPDGGLSDRWVVIRLGRIPMPFLNTSARRRALTLHDVNHLVACFGTGNVGEAEISAWELASGGCGRYVAAWGLDLAGLLLGMVWPIHVVRAFAAGRSTGNAYAFDLEEILDLELSELRRALIRPKERNPLRSVGSIALFVAYLLLAIPVGAAFLVMVAISIPIWALTKDEATPA